MQLRFDVLHSPTLPKEVRVRLIRIAGKKMTRDGVLIITAQRHRSQDHNRKDALERLVDMIRLAAIRPTLRKADDADALVAPQAAGGEKIARQCEEAAARAAVGRLSAQPKNA